MLRFAIARQKSSETWKVVRKRDLLEFLRRNAVTPDQMPSDFPVAEQGADTVILDTLTGDIYFK